MRKLKSIIFKCILSSRQPWRRNHRQNLTVEAALVAVTLARKTKSSCKILYIIYTRYIMYLGYIIPHIQECFFFYFSFWIFFFFLIFCMEFWDWLQLWGCLKDFFFFHCCVLALALVSQQWGKMTLRQLKCSFLMLTLHRVKQHSYESSNHQMVRYIISYPLALH